MVIQGGKVFLPDGSFVEQDVFVSGERFSETGSGSDVINADGCYVIPGLIDVHFHGCMGHDFCEIGRAHV